MGSAARLPGTGMGEPRLLDRRASGRDVFLSHSSKDFTFAQQVQRCLEEGGLSVWIAPRDIRAGEHYGAEIIRGIESCSTLVLLLSSHSNASTPVRNEVERAFDKGKRIVPLKLEPVVLSQSLEFFLAGAQWVDASDGLDQALARLLGTFATQGSEPPQPTARRAPAQAFDELSLDAFSEKKRAPALAWFLRLFEDK
jgi:hypothetical protein